MDGILAVIVSSIKSLELEKRLSPRKNPDIAWFYVFFPAFIAYIVLLTTFLNAKPVIGSIESYNASFSKFIDPFSKMEIIANGSTWAEGPLWVVDESSSSYLLYSDTMTNKIMKWEEGKGLFTIGKIRLINKSGCKSNETRCEALREGGSNAMLTLLPKHRPPYATNSIDLLVCQHGERAISLFRENGTRSVIVDNFKGRRFNSPNDMIWSPEGHLYFTDPPYGLYDTHGRISERQLPFSGIFMVKSDAVAEAIRTGVPVDGEKDVRLLHKDMRRPNGLAFSPDYSKLYVSNSELTDPYWKVFDVTDSGGLVNGLVFFNASQMTQETEGRGGGEGGGEVAFGAPDGFKVDIYGNIFASGPGGVLVIDPDAVLLGRLRLDRPVSNVAFGEDGRLYLTARDLVIRLRVKSKPVRIIHKL